MTTPQAIRTLALSVHFRHPKLGMKNYEILSRASAFLLAVDPPNSEHHNFSNMDLNDDPYAHLQKYQDEQMQKDLKRSYSYDPAGGTKREASNLGWLEFCPKDNRPIAHVIASSHVLAPWLWKEYYPQDWISQVEQEHCAYSLDVFCSTQPDKSLAKFALNPYPIHHPNNLDLSMIHLKNENAALNHMKDLGVEMLHLRDTNDDFIKSEKVYFEGFEIEEDVIVDNAEDDLSFDEKTKQDDTRPFIPYTAEGSLFLFSSSRFLASTTDPSSSDNINKPLPQGLCGGPVLDRKDRVCGVVEGIVPMDHPDENLAGAAAFIPLHHLHDFVEWAECFILQQVVPDKLFNKIRDIKENKEVEFGGNFGQDKDVTINDISEISEKSNAQHIESKYATESTQITAEDSRLIEKDLDEIKQQMEQNLTQEQLDLIYSTVEEEKRAVIDLLQTEGGDMDAAVAKVRARTLKKQMKIMKKIEKEQGETIIVEEDEPKGEDKKT